MGYKKFDIITLEDNQKLIILETLEYEGNTYLYVDEVSDDEKDTLENYHILRAYDDMVERETDQDTLINILPLFSRNIKITGVFIRKCH